MRLMIMNFNPFYVDKKDKSGLGTLYMYDNMNNHHWNSNKITQVLRD